LRVISTFSGCGGSSLGYQLAGCQVALAVEFDPHAVEVYRRNFPKTPIFDGDIATLSVEQSIELAGGKPDILDGSPPCQGFSTAGKRKVSDPRNTLFREYVRLLDGLQPKAFVMENVPGMVKGKMKRVFNECLKALAKCGYRVNAWVLNAKWYGVPQSRQRLIFIGYRNDLALNPTCPPPHGPVITVRQALADVPHEDAPAMTGKAIKRYLPYVPTGGNMASVTKYSGYNSLTRLRWDKPAQTICKTVCLTGLGSMIHPDEDRMLTIAELKRLHTFPDSFDLGTDYIEAVARIGNSVPPMFMREIAGHIMKCLTK